MLFLHFESEMYPLNFLSTTLQPYPFPGTSNTTDAKTCNDGYRLAFAYKDYAYFLEDRRSPFFRRYCLRTGTWTTPTVSTSIGQPPAVEWRTLFYVYGDFAFAAIHGGAWMFHIPTHTWQQLIVTRQNREGDTVFYPYGMVGAVYVDGQRGVLYLQHAEKDGSICRVITYKIDDAIVTDRTHEVEGILGESEEKRLQREIDHIRVKHKETAEQLQQQIDELQTAIGSSEYRFECNICARHRPSVVFQCGHVACSACSQLLETCHICRKVIENKINMFLV